MELSVCGLELGQLQNNDFKNTNHSNNDLITSGLTRQWLDKSHIIISKDCKAPEVHSSYKETNKPCKV